MLLKSVIVSKQLISHNWQHTINALSWGASLRMGIFHRKNDEGDNLYIWKLITETIIQRSLLITLIPTVRITTVITIATTCIAE